MSGYGADTGRQEREEGGESIVTVKSIEEALGDCAFDCLTIILRNRDVIDILCDTAPSDALPWRAVYWASGGERPFVARGSAPEEAIRAVVSVAKVAGQHKGVEAHDAR